MRSRLSRLLTWTLPTAIALLAAVTFGWGLYLGTIGSPGKAIDASGTDGPSPSDTGPRDGIRVLLLGDSLARGVGDLSGRGVGGALEDELQDRMEQPVELINLAISGAVTFDLHEQIDRPGIQRMIRDADVLVISIGGNDLFRPRLGALEPPDSAEEDLELLVEPVAVTIEALLAIDPTNRVFLIGLYNPFEREPRGAELSRLVTLWNAGLMKRLAFEPRVTVVQTADLFTGHDRLSADRFHPGSEAYRLIGRRIADAL